MDFSDVTLIYKCVVCVVYPEHLVLAWLLTFDDLFRTKFNLNSALFERFFIKGEATDLESERGRITQDNRGYGGTG